MAILKSDSNVLNETGQRLGVGTAYLHLPHGLDREQEGTGTISLRSWEPTDAPPAELRLEDGRRLAIRVSRDALSECSRNRVLRFTLRWPPAGAVADPSG